MMKLLERHVTAQAQTPSRSHHTRRVSCHLPGDENGQRPRVARYQQIGTAVRQVTAAMVKQTVWKDSEGVGGGGGTQGNMRGCQIRSRSHSAPTRQTCS